MVPVTCGEVSIPGGTSPLTLSVPLKMEVQEPLEQGCLITHD